MHGRGGRERDGKREGKNERSKERRKGERKGKAEVGEKGKIRGREGTNER